MKKEGEEGMRRNGEKDRKEMDTYFVIYDRDSRREVVWERKRMWTAFSIPLSFFSIFNAEP